MQTMEKRVTWGILLVSILILLLLPSQVKIMSYGRPGDLAISSATFPIMTAVIMAVLSIFYLIMLNKEKKAQEAEEEEKPAFIPVIGTVVVLLIYTYLLDKLGFILDTILLCTLLTIYFKARPWQILVAGISVPLIINFLFKLMYVNLPKGFWG